MNGRHRTPIDASQELMHRFCCLYVISVNQFNWKLSRNRLIKHKISQWNGKWSVRSVERKWSSRRAWCMWAQVSNAPMDTNENSTKYYWKSRLASPLCCCVMRPPAVWNNNRIFFLVKKGHNMVYADARRLSTMSSLNPNQQTRDDSTVIMMLRDILSKEQDASTIFLVAKIMRNWTVNEAERPICMVYQLPIECSCVPWLSFHILPHLLAHKMKLFIHFHTNIQLQSKHTFHDE